LSIDDATAPVSPASSPSARSKKAKEAEKVDDEYALAADIIKELTIHMAAEEEVFYAAVKTRSEDISHDVDEGFEEHRVAEEEDELFPEVRSSSET
jgi:hemerythrin superfamily protein